MRRALRLAERGRGRVNPNPVVGAVVVRAGRVVGQGWHRALGEPHAEAMALAQAGAHARGATLYVTLEPCAHVGRTPPCVEALIRAGIRRCVVAARDPHRVVNGRGLRRLRAAGIRVEVGVLGDEVRRQLAGYQNIPFYLAMFRAAGFPQANEGYSDALLDDLVVSGTEQEVVERLAALYAVAVQRVREQTAIRDSEKVLQKKFLEIEKLNKYMMGREMRVVEVKREVNALLKEINRPLKYKV